MSLHRKKIGLLHVAKAQLGLEDADYRQILRDRAGVDSAAELGEGGFLAVLSEFERRGFRSTASRRTYGNDRPGFATAAQVHLIRQLWREYHGGEGGDVALNAWLERFHHVSALRFVTSFQAAKIIPGLKAMAARTRQGP